MDAERLDLQRKISRVNWNQVYYFSLVATYGSIRSTAEILNLSPSTLSEHISQLEAHLDVQLLIRSGPRISLSKAGQRLYLYAKGMFENGQRLLDVVSPLKLGCYPVSVGISSGAHSPVVGRFLRSYLKEFGPLDMTVASCSRAELETSLIQAKIDFGFSDRQPTRKDLSYRSIANSTIRFFVSPQWRGHSLKEVLKKLPLLVAQSETSTDALIEETLQDLEIQPCAVIRGEPTTILIDLCKSGVGVGAFPETSMDQNVIDSLHVLRNPKEAPKIEIENFLIWAKDGENTAAIANLKQLVTSNK